MRARLGFALGVTLVFATDSVADRLVSTGIYCVYMESSEAHAKTLRQGAIPPQYSFVASNRAEIEDDRKIYGVAPLNDQVFRALARLSRDAQVCVSANRITSRHGVDILLAWHVESCTDPECSKVKKIDTRTQDRPPDEVAPSPPTPLDEEPSNHEPAPGDGRAVPTES